MTDPADIVLTDGAVYSLAEPPGDGPDGPALAGEALAIRDGRIVRVDSTYEIEFLNGVDTRVIDLDGRTALPGFVDGHTHLDFLGQRQREADLGIANSREACLDALRDRWDETDDGWVLGFGYDESQWDPGASGTDDPTYLTSEDLDAVSTDRPVAAFREDMHVVSLNSVALDRYRDEMAAENVRMADGEPTGVVVEEAVSVISAAIRPDREGLRGNLLAAQEYAHRHGVTAVHDMVSADTARAYRDIDLAGDLSLRVRLNYYDDHVDAVLGAGLASNHGSEHLRMGAIKAFVDGSIGGRTARVSEPYHDGPAETDEHGDWVTTPEELDELADRVAGAGLQLTVHAIGDEAIAAALETLDEAPGERHRIEHAEILTDELIERLADSDVVVSGQPNFLKWARADGLYDTRLGEARRKASNRFGQLHDAGATLAFGSDCMPLDPLFGIDQVVTGPEPSQQLGVTEALRAYTHGAARAGFDEDRMGTLEVGKCGDLVVLEESPWDADDIAEVGVAMTVVGGSVVYDGRN